jgi:tRNA G37 N-methylase Trm5
MVIVIAPEINNKSFIAIEENIGKNRIKRNTPAVTKVDE